MYEASIMKDGVQTMNHENDTKKTMRMQEFHVINDDDEIDLLKSLLFSKSLNIFFKRMILIALICAFIYVMQYMARLSLPHIFHAADSVDRLRYKVIMLFLGTNILSFVELTIKDFFAFEKERTEVAIVRVKKKMKKEILGILLSYQTYLMCVEAPEIGVDENGFTLDKSKISEAPSFLVDGIFINGFINFSQVKEGQYIFIKRKYYDGYYKYYYIA